MRDGMHGVRLKIAGRFPDDGPTEPPNRHAPLGLLETPWAVLLGN